MKKCIYLLALLMLLLCACSNKLQPDRRQIEYNPTFSSSSPPSTQDKQLLNLENEPISTPTPIASEPTNEPKSTPKRYTYEVSARIHENMPEYRFVASGEDIFVTGLKAYNENDESILSLSNEPESCPVYPEMMDTMGLHVTDVNFDGYKDVIVLNCFHGAHANSWYDCWLWDVKESAFIHSESFVNICNPALDRVKKCIYSTGGSGAGNHSWDIYKFINGVFVISNSLSFEGLNDEESGNFLGFQVTEKALKDGKMEIVHNDVIHEVESFEETNYNNELWELKNPRWYGTGGHVADKWLE